MNTISIDTANLILEAFAYAYVRTDPNAPRAEDCATYEEYEKYTKVVEAMAKRLFIDFCEDKGIEGVDDGTDDEEPDIPDDVDESNYDPYSGCDIYEADDMF